MRIEKCEMIFLGEMNCISKINVYNLWVFYLALIFIFKINIITKRRWIILQFRETTVTS